MNLFEHRRDRRGGPDVNCQKHAIVRRNLVCVLELGHNERCRFVKDRRKHRLGWRTVTRRYFSELLNGE